MDPTEDQNLETDTGVETAEPASSLEAIDQALGYAEPKPVEPELDAEGKPVAKPADAPKVDASGKPITEAKPAPKVDVKPAPAAKPGEKKAPDHTTPAGLSPEATRRFQTLVGDNKAVRAENDTLKAQVEQFKPLQEAHQGFQTLFADSKMAPEQFGLAIDYVKAVNHGNYEQAAQIIANELHNLQLITGRDFMAPDPLKQFPDLAAAVAEQKVTRQHAMEIARGRTNERNQNQSAQARQQAETQEREHLAAIDKGGADVDAWCKQMASTDIDFAAKQQALSAKIDWLATNVQPSKWVAHLQQFYELIGSGTSAPRQQTQHQPLRANGGAGGAKPAPGSMLEALEQGLGYQA